MRTIAAGAATFSSRQILLADSRPLFEDVPPEKSGIHWTHDNRASANKLLPETTGAGCAFLDFDNDGWMDIYLANSAPSKNALYRNNRDGTFTDVTERAGVVGGNFGMGVAIGDYDNDGYQDILVTGVGRCILYHNNGDGTFKDVTAASGLAALSDWTTSATWFDFDGDGRLDLFICSYMTLAEARRHCGSNEAGRHYYCSPVGFSSTASHLFHNNGDGTFTEVGHESVIGASAGKSLGVVATDVNDDGRLDLFVANDTVRNFLFMNRGPDSSGRTRWEEIGVEAGVAYTESGDVRSGMGVDAANVFGDRQDLFVCNISKEAFSLYRNRGKEQFEDAAFTTSIGQVTRMLSGWGVKFFDFNNDSQMDLIIANGHPNDAISQFVPEIQYRQRLVLLQGEHDRFSDVSSLAGPAFASPISARGLAVGDFNNDGLVDVLITVNGGAPVLLKNASNSGNHWLGLHLGGVSCNRDAIGARIRWSVNGTVECRFKSSGGSFLSAHDPRIVLGLGTAKKVDWLEIAWPSPSTRVQRFENVPIDCYLSLTEGRDLSTASKSTPPPG